jgi:hypothetical protein
MLASPLRYSLRAGLALLPCAGLAAWGERAPLGLALLLLPAVGVPVWMGLAHRAAARRVDARSALREGERPAWAPLLGGGLGLHLAGAALGGLAAWSLAAALVTGGWEAFGWCLATALAVPAAARLLLAPTAALRPYARPGPILRWAPLLAALPLALAWGLAAGAEEGSLAARVGAEARYEGPSALLAWAVDAAAAARGLRGAAEAWAEAQVGAWGAWALAAWRLGAAAAQFALWGLVFAPALLAPGEARRILRPSGADDPEPVGPWRLALAWALGAVLVLSLGRGLVAADGLAAALDARGAAPAAMTDAPSLAGAAPAEAPGLGAAGPPDARPGGPPPPLTPSVLRAAIEAEAVGELLCAPGTVAALARLDAGVAELLAERRGRVEAAARAGFDAMRANVAPYLDWHYSLGAEYARTGHLLIGDGAGYLDGRIRGFLEAGAPMGALEAALAQAADPSPVEAAQAARAALLAGCRDGGLPRDDAALLVTAEAPGALLLAPPVAVPFEARLGLSAGGGVAGAVVGSVMAKVAVSAGFKAAAAALAKVAAAKGAGLLGGVALGAGAGAAGGSAVPGLGTAVGGVVGGVLGGIGVGVAVDAALVELDEAVTRDAFEAELLGAIGAAEAELLAALAG